MICNKCGRNNPDDNQFCAHCGSALDAGTSVGQQPQQPIGESKTVIGVVLALFLSLIGLIIGLLLYPSGSYERRTFLNGWLKCFIICLVIEIILACIVYFCLLSFLGDYLGSYLFVN